jgi:hypothetical protein
VATNINNSEEAHELVCFAINGHFTQIALFQEKAAQMSL